MKVYSRSQKKIIDIPDNQPAPTGGSAMPVESATQPKEGIIRRVAGAIVKPGVDFLKMVGGAGYEGVRAIKSAAGDKNAYVNQDTGADVQNPFLSEDDLKKMSPSAQGGYTKPILEGAKRTAGAMTYAVPGGAGVGGAIKTGAVAGGLYGFSQSKKDDLEGLAVDTATGAGTGAVTGGAIGLAGKAIQKMKGAGDAARSGVASPKVTADPFMAEEEKAIMNTLSKNGLKGSAEAQKQQMPQVFRTISANVKKKLQSSTGSITTADVTRMVDESLDNNVNFDSTIPLMQKAKDKYINQIVASANKGQDSALVIKPAQLFELKQNLGKQLSNAFKKMDRGTPLTEKEEVAMTVWHTLDDMITKAEPAVKEMTKAQSYLYKAMPGLAESSKKGLSIPLIGNIGTAANQVKQGVQDLTGRVLQKLGEVGKVVTPEVQNATVKAATIPAINSQMPPEPTIPEVQGISTDQATQPPSMEGVPQAQNTEWTQGEDGRYYSKDKQWVFDESADDWVPAGQSGGGPDWSDEQYVVSQMQADLAATGGKNIPEIKSMYEIAKTQMGSKMNATQQKRVATLNQAQGIYDMVEKIALAAPTGLMGVGQAIGGKFPGVEGGAAEDLDRTTRALAKGIAGAMANEVGVATDRDIERWMGLMPKVSDTMDERKRVLERLKTAIQLAREQVSTLQGDAAAPAAQ